jgi:hypothetical protein
LSTSSSRVAAGNALAVAVQPEEQMIFMKTDLGAEVRDNLIFIEKQIGEDVCIHLNQ